MLQRCARIGPCATLDGCSLDEFFDTGDEASLKSATTGVGGLLDAVSARRAPGNDSAVGSHPRVSAARRELPAPNVGVAQSLCLDFATYRLSSWP